MINNLTIYIYIYSFNLIIILSLFFYKLFKDLFIYNQEIIKKNTIFSNFRH